MPLGVEHLFCNRAIALPSLVFKPLMPLGVEHIPQTAPDNSVRDVFKPLMPLGVEHLGTGIGTSNAFLSV